MDKIAITYLATAFLKDKQVDNKVASYIVSIEWVNFALHTIRIPLEIVEIGPKILSKSNAKSTQLKATVSS